MTTRHSYYGSGANYVLRHTSQTQRGNVFTSFADWAKVAAGIDGWQTLTIDSRFGDVVLPTGVFQIPPKTQIVGWAPPGTSPNGRLSTWKIPEGCQLPGLRYILGDVFTVVEATTTPVVPASDFTVAGDWIVLGGSYGISGVPFFTSAGAPLFDIGDSFTRISLRGRMDQDTLPVVNVGDAGILFVGVYNHGSLIGDWLSGSATASVSIIPYGGRVFNFPASYAGSWEMVPNIPGELYSFGCTSVAAAADNRWLPPGVTTVTAATSPRLQYPEFIRDGWIQNISAFHNATNGDGDPVVYQAFLDGIATGVQVSVPTGVRTGSSDGTLFSFCEPPQHLAMRAQKAANITDGACEPIVTVHFYPNEAL
jgi:hypothetical protein